MWWRTIVFVSSLIIAGAAIAHWRSETSYRSSPAAEAMRGGSVTMSGLTPGRAGSSGDNTYYETSGFHVNEGKRLYRWFNCVGCHANGGGDIGPPLMDDKWIYGSEPRNIFETILEGRPNGMPAYRGKIPEAQVWQIVAYVRSMSGMVPFYARPGRNDALRATQPETMVPSEQPKSIGSQADPRTTQ